MAEADFPDTGSEPEIDDALMYAITGEPMSSVLATTTAGVRERAEAERTVAVLRRGLTALGTELARPQPATSWPAAARRRRVGAAESVPRSWSYSRLGAMAAAVVGLAAAVGVVLTTLQAPQPADTGSRSRAGVVACAETIAVGTVTAVRPQHDRMLVTLDVERYLKPDVGLGPLTITVPGSARNATPPDWRVGERAMVVVHDGATGDVDRFTGADINTEWAQNAAALPDSRRIDPSGCDNGE